MFELYTIFELFVRQPAHNFHASQKKCSRVLFALFTTPQRRTNDQCCLEYAAQKGTGLVKRGRFAEDLECNVTYYTNSSLPREAVVVPVVNVVLAFSVVAIVHHAIMQLLYLVIFASLVIFNMSLLVVTSLISFCCACLTA